MADKNVEKKAQNENTDASGGVSSPTETIKTCFDIVDEVVKHKGTATPITRQEISVITGKAAPTLIMKLSSCVQLGILNNVFGRGYQPSFLYEQFINPIYEDDKRKALLKILINPSLYRSLIEEFNGKILPSEQGLINHLRSKYKVNDNSAIRAAKIFLENLRFTGTLDVNNRLRYIIPNEGLVNEENREETNNTNDNAQSKILLDEERKNSTQSNNNTQSIKFQFPLTDGKTATIEYPKNLTKRDMKMVVKALNFMSDTAITDIGEDDDIEILFKEKAQKSG